MLDLAINQKGEEGQLVSIPVNRISKVIAVQISMSYNSVESYGMLAKFLDEISEKDEVFLRHLLRTKSLFPLKNCGSLHKWMKQSLLVSGEKCCGKKT